MWFRQAPTCVFGGLGGSGGGCFLREGGDSRGARAVTSTKSRPQPQAGPKTNGIARITGMPRLVLILRILSRLDHAPRAADASRSTLVSRSGGVVVYTRQVRIRAI